MVIILRALNGHFPAHLSKKQGQKANCDRYVDENTKRFDISNLYKQSDRLFSSMFPSPFVLLENHFDITLALLKTYAIKQRLNKSDKNIKANFAVEFFSEIIIETAFT